MKQELLYEYLCEVLRDRSFIDHVKTGLSYARGDHHAEAYQIASDWLEDVELSSENLLSPGQCTFIERFVVREWPGILEQFRGDKRLALIAMTNMLDAKLDELR